jgi:hypothetical protein
LQGTHELLFGIDAKKPGEHGEQAVALPVEYVPGGQPTHSLPRGAEPGGQFSGKHSAEPAAAAVPFGHGEHALANGPENLLAPHWSHSMEPSA